MPRPTKGNIKPNQKYLKDWDEYQKDRLPSKNSKGNVRPILLPVIIGMNGKGELTRERMEAPDVAKLAQKLEANLPDYMFDRDLTKYDPHAIFADYLEYFEGDGSQGPRPPSPLDLCVSMPVWMLFYLKPKAWTFSKDRQYRTENDPNDMCRNLEKISTMDKGNALLISNRRRCAPKGLKFNLHVTITQQVDGKVMKTPIIIDPDSDNDEGSGGFGFGGG